MIVHSTQLRDRDVINVCSGKRLGYICDFLLDCECGKITAILVSDHYFVLGSGKNPVCIPWEKICCIGKDAILVRLEEKECSAAMEEEISSFADPCKKKTGRWFFG